MSELSKIFCLRGFLDDIDGDDGTEDIFKQVMDGSTLR
jgi:hypothetical protein